MMQSSVVPGVDAAGLPGPVWSFEILLLLTFFLHLLFMNLTLGGTLLAWISHWRSSGRGDSPHGVLARRLTAVNGYGISLAITTGVAPLLFVQTLYQQFFYAGTILVGAAWLGMLLLLAVGYYATYLYKFRGAPARGTGGGIWIAISALSFLAIAVVHVVVHLVHVQPGRWADLDARPWSILADPTFGPRLLHFVLAGLGFSALVMTWWSVRRAKASGADVELETAIARSGWRWVWWTTVLQVLDGFLLLWLLPRDVLGAFMRSGAATLVPLTLAVLGGIGLLVMLARVRDPLRRYGTVGGTLVTMVLVMAFMSITRHQIRSRYLEPHMDLASFTVVPQWTNLLLFVVLLAAALFTVWLMVRKTLDHPASGSDAA